jgi:hypothetical protein
MKADRKTTALLPDVRQMRTDDEQAYASADYLAPWIDVDRLNVRRYVWARHSTVAVST